MQANVWSYLALLFLEREMFWTQFGENQSTHFMLNKLYFFFRIRAVYEIMWEIIL